MYRGADHRCRVAIHAGPDATGDTVMSGSTLKWR